MWILDPERATPLRQWRLWCDALRYDCVCDSPPGVADLVAQGRCACGADLLVEARCTAWDARSVRYFLYCPACSAGYDYIQLLG